MKIRKKPVEVDGWRIVDLLGIARMGAAALPKEVRQAYTEGVVEFETDRLTIATNEGVMTGWEGWWLIRGVNGEWYPCDDDAFMKSYDIVTPDEQQKLFNTPVFDPYANSPEV